MCLLCICCTNKLSLHERTDYMSIGHPMWSSLQSPRTTRFSVTTTSGKKNYCNCCSGKWCILHCF
jgi:hypothetical protein